MEPKSDKVMEHIWRKGLYKYCRFFVDEVMKSFRSGDDKVVSTRVTLFGHFLQKKGFKIREMTKWLVGV